MLELEMQNSPELNDGNRVKENREGLLCSPRVP